MVTTVEFGSRDSANSMRDRIEGFLANSDSRVEKTIKLKDNTPQRIIERVESEALGSQSSDRQSYGKAKLTDSERQSLKRQHSTFSWQQHGFEAMSVKAGMQSQGVTEWQDYYEPGEGVESALSKVRDAKRGAQQTRASQGIGGKRTDQEETGNRGRRARQAERAQAGRAKSAKEPALLEQDTDAIEFLREEQRFEDDLFDVAFGESDRFGRPVGSGRDYQTLRERHEQRSERAQELDEQKHAPITRDPIKWSQNPGEYDFPGIDTLNPEKKHESRSERAQEVDESELAPKADSPKQWAQNPDEYDLPGIDTPPAMDLGPNQSIPSDVGMQENDGFDNRRIEREIEGETEFASDVVEETPRGFGGLASAFDISLTPDEAFGGTAVVSDRELGGNVLGEGERAPSTEPEKPPEQALRAQSGGIFSEDQYEAIQDIASTGAAGKRSDTLEDLYWDRPDTLGQDEARALEDTARALTEREKDRADTAYIDESTENLLPELEYKARRFRRFNE